MKEIREIIFDGFAANCYLIKTDSGFVLIDTARAGKRKVVEKALGDAGCSRGELKLVILTHGDFDHTGNGAYFQKEYGAKIAMHTEDAGMVAQGDMFLGRANGNAVVRKMVNLMFRIARFSPDITIDEQTDLSGYGLKVLHLPGHSRGSIGILTQNGDLFCGDLFANVKKPTFGDMMDDMSLAKGSAEKLGDYDIRKVYPGHGQPFMMQDMK